MKPTQVMIVEDEALVGIYIQDNLVNYGYDVVGISNTGEAAIENATRTKPQVILMDIQLNGKMDGIETAKQIRKNLGIPIIYLTAYSDDKTLTKALEASPAGYLLKPFVPRELHTSIQTALHNSANTEIKFDAINYAQTDIIRQNSQITDLKSTEADNEKLPQKTNERKLAQLNYILKSIHKRKKNEAKILENAKHRKKIESLLGDLLFPQTIENYNPYIFPMHEFASTLDYDKEEIYKMRNLTLFLLIHPDDLQIMEHYFQQILSDPGMVSEIEFRLKHKSGVWRWFSARGVYYEEEKGKGKILHFVQDVSWIKNLINASHIVREKFSAVSNNPYLGIIILDTDGRVMSINPTLEKLTGHTKETLIFLNWTDYVGLRDLRTICQNFEKLKTGLIRSFQVEAFLHTKHNGGIWGYMVFNAIYTTDKILDRIVVTVVDISESKLYEKNVNSII